MGETRTDLSRPGSWPSWPKPETNAAGVAHLLATGVERAYASKFGSAPPMVVLHSDGRGGFTVPKFEIRDWSAGRTFEVEVREATK